MPALPETRLKPRGIKSLRSHYILVTDKPLHKSTQNLNNCFFFRELEGLSFPSLSASTSTFDNYSVSTLKNFKHIHLFYSSELWFGPELQNRR